MRKTYKGLYKPENPEKYLGDPSNIVFRSLWERHVMIFLDKNANVIKWGSEEIAIPYVSPIDGKVHRYFPDFVVVAVEGSGYKTMILEVKPHKETVPPKPPKRKTKKYLTEEITYTVNMAKFTAAEKFCEEKGWTFQVITEHKLGINK